MRFGSLSVKFCCVGDMPLSLDFDSTYTYTSTLYHKAEYFSRGKGGFSEILKEIFAENIDKPQSAARPQFNNCLFFDNDIYLGIILIKQQ